MLTKQNLNVNEWTTYDQAGIVLNVPTCKMFYEVQIKCKH